MVTVLPVAGLNVYPADADDRRERGPVGAPRDRQRLGPRRPRRGRRQLEHDPADAEGRAEVDLQPLRERVVGALPVRVGVAVHGEVRGLGAVHGAARGGGLVEATFVVVPMPLPARATVVGLLTALLVIVRAPVRLPLAVGRNVTLTVQEAPTARLVPQVFVWAKSPLVATDEIEAVAVPVFWTDTDCAALVVPTIALAKLRLDGVADERRTGRGPGSREAARCSCPRPSRSSACPCASRPRSGRNVTLTVQDAPAARLAAAAVRLGEVARDADRRDRGGAARAVGHGARSGARSWCRWSGRRTRVRWG